MKTIKSYTTKNQTYKLAKRLTVKGLMLHSVACPQPKAKVFIGQFDNASVEKSVHGFIDASDFNFYQTLPFNIQAWHCGGSGNQKYIGIEMCEPANIKYTGPSTFTSTDPAKAKATIKKTYNAAVELFADLCIKYKLDPMKDIHSHKEGHDRGEASNHGDADHLLKYAGLSMDKFRKAVKAEISSRKKPSAKKEETKKSASSSSKKEETKKKTTTKKTTTSSKKEHVVIINAAKLNVRKGAGVRYAVTTTVKKGDAYTITEEKNGWGKLKSGAGWINLAYTKKK